MYRIVSGITSLQQHLSLLSATPDVYRPCVCPHCGLNNPWRHGQYHRKADHDQPAQDSLNPVPIPRFRCRGCGRTCSRLPTCIAPRRWYAWEVQQQVLLILLTGGSLRAASTIAPLSRHTCRRWWRWLTARSESFEFHLRSRFAELGRAVDSISLWRTCLMHISLAGAMAWLDQNGVAVP